jgi:hypothetical protein
MLALFGSPRLGLLYLLADVVTLVMVRLLTASMHQCPPARGSSPPLSLPLHYLLTCSKIKTAEEEAMGKLGRGSSVWGPPWLTGEALW